MKPEDYPPQEPLSDFARPYHDKVMALGASLIPEEHRYGEDAYQSLAVFKPENPDGSTLITWHGGGWTNGYKEWMYFMAPALTGQGITFVSAGYRLAPRHVFPAGFDDCAAAVDWVYRNAGLAGADRDRIFLSGHSAGGHYASLLAVRSDWQAPRDLPRDVVTGCLPISGVYTFGDGSGLSMRPRFLDEESKVTSASPLAHVADPPPFLIACGSDDFPHLREQARAMADALQAAGGDVESIELSGCDHLGASYAAGRADGPWVTAAAAWIKER